MVIPHGIRAAASLMRLFQVLVDQLDDARWHHLRHQSDGELSDHRPWNDRLRPVAREGALDAVDREGGEAPLVLKVLCLRRLHSSRDSECCQMLLLQLMDRRWDCYWNRVGLCEHTCRLLIKGPNKN